MVRESLSELRRTLLLKLFGKSVKPPVLRGPPSGERGWRSRISPSCATKLTRSRTPSVIFQTVSLSSRVNSPCATLRVPDLARCRAHFSGGLFDEFSHGCRLRHINRMAARGLLNGRTRSRRHRALGRWWDHPVFGRDEVPAWLAPPCRLADRAAQGFNAPRDLRVGHKLGLIGTQVARELLMELFPVEEQEALLRRQNSVSRVRLAGREGSDERFHRLALVRHEGRDVDERRHFGIVARLGDHRSAIGMANEDDGFALLVDDHLGRLVIALV